MNRPVKSPIKANPLRQPGQSVHEQIIDLWIEREPETVSADAVRHATSQLAAHVRKQN